MVQKVTIVSSSDDRYAPLLLELIESIRAHPQSQSVDLSVISAGMTDAVAREVRERVDNFAEGHWHYPGFERRFAKREWLKGRIVKMFLPEYFPGYDVYIWLDADCWVCDWRAIDLFVRGAQRSGLAMTFDGSAGTDLALKISWFLGRVPMIRTYCYKHAKRAHLPIGTVRRLTALRPFNGGAFALTYDAPQWESVQGYMGQLTKRGRVFGANQLAFVMAVHLDGHPIEILPDRCNFIGQPKVCARTGRFVEPYLPHFPIGILHLAGQDAIRDDPLHEIELEDTDGGTVRRTLRYRPESIVATPTAAGRNDREGRERRRGRGVAPPTGDGATGDWERIRRSSGYDESPCQCDRWP